MKQILLLLSVFVSSLAFAQSEKNHYKIYDTKLQKVVQTDDIISAMEQADVLFFGEEHNDSIGHYLETKILKDLFQKFGKRTALSMEMFHTDIQDVVDEYLAGAISEKNFIKEARAWNNHKDYRPAVEFAKENNLAVIAANAATRYSNAVTMKGMTALSQFPKTIKKYLPELPIDTLTGRYYDKFIETLGGHSMGGMKIYQTQNLWDATMAWSIQKHLKKYKNSKILHLVGRFHSDEKLGTFAKLVQQNPKIRALNISSFSADDFKNPDWQKYSNLGDYIIVTDPDVKRSY